VRTDLFPLLALPLALAACGGAPSDPNAPRSPAEAAAPPASCDLLEGATSLRVAALPHAERDQLQTWLLEGPVAVRMDGCRFTPVRLCYARASASYTATSAETSLTLTSESDVAREVPAASERLAPIVRAGRAVELTLLGAGRFDYQSNTLERHFNEDACKEATHIVTGYWVGALAIEERGGAAIERSGDRAGCARASASPGGPPPGCSDLLTLDLAPIAAITARAPAPQPAPPAPVVSGQHGPGTGIIRGGGSSEATDSAEGGVGKEDRGACEPDDPFCNLDSRSKKP